MSSTSSGDSQVQIRALTRPATVTVVRSAQSSHGGLFTSNRVSLELEPSPALLMGSALTLSISVRKCKGLSSMTASNQLCLSATRADSVASVSLSPLLALASEVFISSDWACSCSRKF